MLPPSVTRALTTLLDAAGDDPVKTREDIERWYDDAMQRVSNGYKQSTQITLVAIGLVVAAAVNADSISMVTTLSTNKSVRLESTPAVGGTKNPALRVGPIRMTEHRHQQPVRIARIDRDARDLLSIRSPKCSQVLPASVDLYMPSPTGRSGRCRPSPLPTDNTFGSEGATAIAPTDPVG